MTTTAITFASVCLILLMAAAAALIIVYMKRLTELEHRRKDLDTQERGLNRRHNALDLWEKQIQSKARETASTCHIYATHSFDDPEDSAPEIPDTKTYKKLASKIGYSACKNFRDRIVRVHDNGKTSYKLDLNAYPY